ncbi:Potassium transporter [Elasticomyces elasticus]|nr:Potassium transporter [Elasticomyces elasticus]
MAPFNNVHPKAHDFPFDQTLALASIPSRIPLLARSRRKMRMADRKARFTHPFSTEEAVSVAQTTPFSTLEEYSTPSPTGESYEMTRQASYNTAPAAQASSYVAFHPGMQSASPMPTPPPRSAYLQPGPPRRNITVAGQPGAADNYFAAVRDVPQRSATAPIDPRHTTGYGDIISDYGDSARNSISPPALGMRHREINQQHYMFEKQRDDVPMQDLEPQSFNFRGLAQCLAEGPAREIEMMDEASAFVQARAAAKAPTVAKQEELRLLASIAALKLSSAESEEDKAFAVAEDHIDVQRNMDKVFAAVAALQLHEPTIGHQDLTVPRSEETNVFYNPSINLEDATEEFMHCLRSISEFRDFARNKKVTLYDVAQSLQQMADLLRRGRRDFNFGQWKMKLLIEMEKQLQHAMGCFETLSQYEGCRWLRASILKNAEVTLEKVEGLHRQKQAEEHFSDAALTRELEEALAREDD